MIVYNAESCSVKSLSHDNFEKLGRLKVLLLNDNEIEKLDSFVFADLVSLEWLVLRKQMLLLREISIILNRLHHSTQITTT